METYDNTSYVFLPFCYDKPESFLPLVQALKNSGQWAITHDEITYMLKYVADKIDSRNSDSCRCFHFTLTDAGRAQLPIPTADTWCRIDPKSEGELTRYRFQLGKIQLYCFSTRVCIIAIQLKFEQSEPLWVSSAQYHLKKVSRTQICWGEGAENAPFTLLEICRQAMAPISSPAFHFFFYANPGTERANFLTLLEVAKQEDYRQELYYLRRCYSRGFLYTENDELDKQEIYSSSQDIIWGVSPEAAVCLICPDQGRRSFFEQTFKKNFNAQYLFMYVLLLHQKYVLYMFLTQIGVGEQNNLAALEEYRRQLYEFETNFVFSCVTEVPQYQNLYERMTQAFALQKLYDDVREPIISLTEIRQTTIENKQKERDKRTNRVLMLLSLISLVSAMMDGFSLIGSFFPWFCTESVVKIIQIIIVIIIPLVFAFLLLRLWRSNKD